VVLIKLIQFQLCVAKCRVAKCRLLVKQVTGAPTIGNIITSKSWVTGHGSRGLWVTKRDPLSALTPTTPSLGWFLSSQG